MEKQPLQQEILVITGNKFSARVWADIEFNNKLSPVEYLENACWNGLLGEMLPEIVEKSSEGKELFLWRVRQCRSFLGIELCECSPTIAQEFSIDPYFFIPSKIMN